MSVNKPKGSKTYYYDFWRGDERFNGVCVGAKTEAQAKRFEDGMKSDAEKEIAQRAANKDSPKTIGQAVARYYAALTGKSDPESIASDGQSIIEFFGADMALKGLCDNDVDNLVQWKRAQFRKGKEHLGLVSNERVNRSTTQLLRRIIRRAVAKNGAYVAKLPNWTTHLLKEGKKRKRLISENEHRSILAAIDRDYAILLQFALVSGLRQLASLLMWNDVNFGERTYSYIGKGGARHVKKMTPAQEAILRSREGHHPEWVFTYVAKKRRAGVRAKGERMPITQSGLLTYWDRLKTDLGIVDLHWHDLRRSFATNVWKKTRDLASVQELLDHGDIATTLLYAIVDSDDVADTAAKAEDTFASRFPIPAQLEYHPQVNATE